MMIIPAIDLKGGRCVRLVEGREESAKVYDRDPVEVARGYEVAGASMIHVIDLDGAFPGSTSENRKIIRRIIEEIRIPVEVGGGIRSLEDIDIMINRVGARYCIIGTLAVEEPDTLRQAVERFRDSIIVGIDARETSVAVRGWTADVKLDALALAGQVAALGVERIIYTDITKDGRLEGPNLKITAAIARASGARVTASGGVGSLDDIASLSALEADGVDSVIIGKALYESRFSLEEAIAAASGRAASI